VNKKILGVIGAVVVVLAIMFGGMISKISDFHPDALGYYMGYVLGKGFLWRNQGKIKLARKGRNWV